MYIKKIIKIFVIVFLPFCIQLFASGRNKTRTVKEVVVDHQDAALSSKILKHNTLWDSFV